MAGDSPVVIDDGVVDVADGRVVWAGAAADAPAFDGVVQRVPGVLLPGFVNTHAHTPMVLLRGVGEGLPVDRWLTEAMWPREGRLTPDDVRWAMRLGAAELLGNGITTSHEMYFYADQVAGGAVDAGLRAVVTPPILPDVALLGGWERQLDAIGDLADEFVGHDRITVGAGPHAAYSLERHMLTAVGDLVRERGLHVHTHVAEVRQEGDGIAAEYGLTVPRYLESVGLLESRLVAAHGIWLTDDDIDLFSRAPVGVAHCAMSNGKHASGIARVSDLRTAGVPVGIATDGPASQDRLDPFEEMRMALRLARLRADDASVLGPGDVLTMATREAADVLGRSDLGRLTPGARADMIAVETETLGPIIESRDILTHLVYSGRPDLVHTVWVEGETVVADGGATGIDVALARREVSQRARRIAEEVT